MRNLFIATAIGMTMTANLACSAKAGRCEKALLDAYCAGATIGLSQGSQESDPDLSTALKVRSADYTTAYQEAGFDRLTQKYLKAGVEDSTHSSDPQVMQSLLGLCVNDEKVAHASFGKRIASDCSGGGKD
jgi:hypothetical protein